MTWPPRVSLYLLVGVLSPYFGALSRRRNVIFISFIDDSEFLFHQVEIDDCAGFLCF